jgi:hypothetical protein
MKLDAMMKIRMLGTSARERKARTSFTLKRRADTLLAALEASFTRLRKRRTSSRGRR